MAQQRKGKGLAITLSFVAIAGVIGYILYRRYKNKNQKPTDTTSSLDVMTPSGSGSSSSSSNTSSSGNPFATKDALLKFQRWVIKTIGDKKILGKGGSTGFGDDGVWGSKSASAWAKYQSPFDPAKVNDDGTMKSTPLPSYLVPQPSPTLQFTPFLKK
jgi:hypothetical protein